MRYFQKFYPQQPLILANGKGFTFPTLQSGIGALATDNPRLLSEFDLNISKNIGGISEITASQFEELKKKARPSNRSEAFSASKLLQLKLAAEKIAVERAAKQAQPLKAISRTLHSNTVGRLNGSGYKPGSVAR